MTLRPPFLVDSSTLELASAELIDTTYKKNSLQEDLPVYANCVTAVRYILEKTIGFRLPHVWVGDLPYVLSLKEWRILTLEKEFLKPGDLIFVGRKINTITHVAMVLNVGNVIQVFHCSASCGGSVKEKIVDFINRYPQVSPEEMDSHNQKFRPALGVELLNMRDPRRYNLT